MLASRNLVNHYSECPSMGVIPFTLVETIIRNLGKSHSYLLIDLLRTVGQ